MVSFTKREQIVILILVILIVFILGYKFFLQSFNNENDVVNSADMINDSKQLENTDVHDNQLKEDNKTIMVHVCGEVNNPGLIVLEDGARVFDAIEKAGGLKEDAYPDMINLAKKVSDEEKIYVPKKVEDLEKAGLSLNIFDYNSVENDKGISSKININTATKEQLESLPGIGAKYAQNIIEYRKNKKFDNIEEITNVSGIGEKRYEAIKDLITIR